GDSRIVLVRDGELKLLTIDHSIVMEMYLRGQLTREQCRESRYKHLITRCLGRDESGEIDYATLEAQPGDCVVLASDGLADEVTEEEIGSIVSKCDGPQDVCDKLLENVLKRGANDNTTIVAIVRESNSVRSQRAAVL
ncbi:MAG: PP2C family protein-serine/threonine phosphatase, partial [Terriglobales bacterium]